jgi:hypothetical protein
MRTALARLSRWWPALVVVVVFVVMLLPLWPVLGVAWIFFLADDDKPIPHTLAALPSPNGRWIATLEDVDNGLGFGLGMVYYEIHVNRPDQPIVNHGDPDHTVVFYIQALGRTPHVAWRDGTHLSVQYDAQDEHGGPAAPGRHEAHHDAVTIDYQALPPLPVKPAAPARAGATSAEAR